MTPGGTSRSSDSLDKVASWAETEEGRYVVEGPKFYVAMDVVELHNEAQREWGKAINQGYIDSTDAERDCAKAMSETNSLYLRIRPQIKKMFANKRQDYEDLVSDMDDVLFGRAELGARRSLEYFLMLSTAVHTLGYTAAESPKVKVGGIGVEEDQKTIGGEEEEGVGIDDEAKEIGIDDS